MAVLLKVAGPLSTCIEVNIWERKRLRETPIVQDVIVGIIEKSGSNEEVIEESCNLFDLLYRRVGN